MLTRKPCSWPAAVSLLLVTALPASAQIDGWSLGLSWAGMQTDYSDGGWSRPNGHRRSLSLSVDTRSHQYAPIVLQSGLRLTTKGYTVSGPTHFIQYLEVPLLASLERTEASGPSITAGLVPGVRIFCRLGATRYDTSCSERGLRWWDISWELGTGFRLRDDAGGAFIMFARYARSLFDIRPSNAGHTVNWVATVGFGFEFAR